MNDDGETEAMNDLLRKHGFEDVTAADRFLWLEHITSTPAHRKKEMNAKIMGAKEIVELKNRQKNFIDLLKLVELADKIEQHPQETTP